MVRAIAYRLQEQRYGGLKPSTQRLLDRVCEGRADVGRKRMPDRRVSADTVLIREWGGVSHRVTVLDHGSSARRSFSGGIDGRPLVA